MRSDRQTDDGLDCWIPDATTIPPAPTSPGGGDKHARNGLLVCISRRKVVLRDILCQMVQKLGFIMQLWSSWRSSWISRLAEGYSLSA